MGPRRMLATPRRAGALLPGALLLAALLLPAAAARAQGTVGLLNKERKVVPQPTPMILSETLDSVRFKTRGGADRTEKTADIASIEYGPGSANWEKALRAEAASDWQNAQDLFTAASKDTDPPWVAAHALLKAAEAAERRGKDGLDAARDAMTEFLKRFPDHRLLPEALLDRAHYAALAGDQPTVDASVAAVIKLASEGKVTPDWATRAQLTAGETALDGGNVAAAKLAYAGAEKAAAAGKNQIADRPDLAPAVEELALQARVGTATCLLASDDVTGARLLFGQLARDGQNDTAVKAAADNGLAECDFRDPAHLKEAQLGFARVAVAAAGVPAERARALYFLGRCAEELGKSKREPDAQARAAAYYEEVVRRYPGTHWAGLARKSLP